MFDIIGIIAFLFMAVSLIALILSVFNRRMNQKLWIISLVVSTVLLMGSYYLDAAFDKEEPIKIDYSGIKLDPTPTPKPKPTPSPKPTPTPMIIEKKTKAPVVTVKPTETPTTETYTQPTETESVPENPVVPETPEEQPPVEPAVQPDTEAEQ